MTQPGGLLTSFKAVKANSLLSAGVALTGIAAPIGLSFILKPLVNASSLQCFAAGAALCSTSLGTTFAVLRSSNLASTRLGVVLTSAAMLDDVVGLVMVQVISDLGSSGASVSVVTIIRPILVSIGFALVAVISSQLIAPPTSFRVSKWRKAHPDRKFSVLLRLPGTAFCVHSTLLIALVTGASYAGTSSLFAAYISGAVISWWHSEVRPVEEQQDRGEHKVSHDASTSLPHYGAEIFEHYYDQPLKRLLRPFFFASIGFSIPISRMFEASVVWKGLSYGALMAIGKLSCGIWLVRLPRIPYLRLIKHKSIPSPGSDAAQRSSEPPRTADPVHREPCISTQGRQMETNQPPSQPKNVESPPAILVTQKGPPRPLSLYPASILGCAMVARGEIGFVIVAVAQSRGIFDAREQTADSEIFLVATWAIVLCTILGPVCVGLLVRRVRRLEQRAIPSPYSSGGARNDAVLGVWGVP